MDTKNTEDNKSRTEQRMFFPWMTTKKLYNAANRPKKKPKRTIDPEFVVEMWKKQWHLLWLLTRLFQYL